MRCVDLTDEADIETILREKPAPWMLGALALNPPYVHWGPGEDYMTTQAGTHGPSWGTSLELDSWPEFRKGWSLDELNECVHFYFEIDRPSKNCDACDRSGYNPATKEIADTFYDHGDYSLDFSTMTIRGGMPALERARRPDGATGRRWQHKITQDEVDALIARGRLRRWTKETGWVSVPRTAEEVNAANAPGRKHPISSDDSLDHDGINRAILIETRAKRLGVWGTCETCEGHGYVYTAPAARLNLVVWMIHPRKGASRGVRVHGLSEPELEEAKAWLTIAARRNADRFSSITRLGIEPREVADAG